MAANPLIVTKSFSPSTIRKGGTSVLTITLNNPNEFGTLPPDFVDTYPSGVINSSSPSASTNIAGATASATAGGNTLTLVGGNISAGETKSITVNVTSNTVGSYINSTGDIPDGASNSVSATLNVIAIHKKKKGAPITGKQDVVYFSPDVFPDGIPEVLPYNDSNYVFNSIGQLINNIWVPASTNRNVQGLAHVYRSSPLLVKFSKTSRAGSQMVEPPIKATERVSGGGGKAGAL